MCIIYWLCCVVILCGYAVCVFVVMSHVVTLYYVCVCVCVCDYTGILLYYINYVLLCVQLHCVCFVACVACYVFTVVSPHTKKGLWCLLCNARGFGASGRFPRAHARDFTLQAAHLLHHHVLSNKWICWLFVICLLVISMFICICVEFESVCECV